MSPLFELRDVHFGYYGQPSCLNGVSFCLQTGERLGLVGANGAGKSTLLHLMVGLNKATSGSIVAFGREFQTEEDFKLLRRRIGLVFQDADDQLFCPTVAEDIAFGPLNLGYGKADAMKIVDEILDVLKLTALRDRVTHKLSGGQKRLVSLATVLAMRPEILLLDEPTNDLDEDTRERLIEILIGLPQTMLLVSHDRAFREAVTTRVISMKDGIVVS
ncbi:ABC transporter ATP-binding protein [uncultured Cohaesibacter sp.]|uniref:energy-coupling factor ABC transporter ATP-binding protein n=1 Tax=uncultured Cohaesibacter sp. TaxID=1002546 RepID=UPI00292F0486|nr:ABC transporter ATP-binding protein [uncultured Cohaesibacter sp.]